MEALIRIQKELKAPKDKANDWNPQDRFKYRSLESILEHLKPLLGNAIFTLSYDLVEMAQQVYIKATATITEADQSVSVTAFARETMQRKGRDSAQLTGAAISYAGKYAAGALFLCEDSPDSDSQPPQSATPTGPADWTPTTGPKPWDGAAQPAAAAPPATPPPATPPPAAAPPQGQIPAPTPEQRKWLKMLWDFYLTQAQGRPMNTPGMHKMLNLCNMHMSRYPGSMNDVEQLKGWIKVEELIG